MARGNTPNNVISLRALILHRVDKYAKGKAISVSNTNTPAVSSNVLPSRRRFRIRKTTLFNISGEASKALINRYTSGSKTPTAIITANKSRYQGGDFLCDGLPIIVLFDTLRRERNLDQI
jgi:hypothetical protein